MRNVLVIDDDAKDADRLCSLLRAEDVGSRLCTTKEAAEVALAQTVDSYVAAFVSIDLGALHGLELLTSCRTLRPDMPIIAIADALDTGIGKRAFVLGAKELVERPIDAEQVRGCLFALLVPTQAVGPSFDRLRSVPLGPKGERLAGESPVFLDSLCELAKAIAHDDARVLLLGESGTGKELYARAIHRLGLRADRPWVAINVASLSKDTIESELFGHEKGAFTGAHELKHGVFELAGNGCLFLDEIGELEPALQVKLLRAFQEREFWRLGGRAPLKLGARLIYATNRDLQTAVQAGSMREDFYHRIAGIIVRLPPLRERAGDVEILADHLLATLHPRPHPFRITKPAQSVLRSYTYPGNVRELQNLIDYIVVNMTGSEIRPSHVHDAFNKMRMGAAANADAAPEAAPSAADDALFNELRKALGSDWTHESYDDVQAKLIRGFDRVYLWQLRERHHRKVTRAAAAGKMDPKTFRKHWRECGLEALTDEETKE